MMKETLGETMASLTECIGENPFLIDDKGEEMIGTNKYKVTYTYESVDKITDKPVNSSASTSMEVEAKDITLVEMPFVLKLDEFCDTQGARMEECEILAIEKVG